MSDQIPMPANEEQAVGVCDALSRFCLACRAVVKAYGLSSGHSIIQSPKGGILFRAARNKIPPLGDWMMLCPEERPYALTTARQARQNRESASQTPTACSSLAGIGIWSDMTARGMASACIGWTGFQAECASILISPETSASPTLTIPPNTPPGRPGSWPIQLEPHVSA